MTMIKDSELVINQTQSWIKKVVIDCNFCPFASKPFLQKSIHYSVEINFDISEITTLLIKEFQRLDNDQAIETSFIIFPNHFSNFQEYLSLIKKSELILRKFKYEGIYQIASFHPEYQFADSEADDAANYTNRSIYPMLHLLREESLSNALKLFKHPESIPETNIKYAREKGLKYMQVLRNTCL